MTLSLTTHHFFLNGGRQSSDTIIVMQKDFKEWHKKKSEIHAAKGRALFHEREVWWCTLGVNIGFEQDGGSTDFGRPVVILKKFNLDTCLVVPLTTRAKSGTYYFPLGAVGGRDAVAVISQVRFLDRKRLSNKICTLPMELFTNLQRRIVEINFWCHP